MSDALSLVEIEGQHGELLPARTELQWAISYPAAHCSLRQRTRTWLPLPIGLTSVSGNRDQQQRQGGSSGN